MSKSVAIKFLPGGGAQLDFQTEVSGFLNEVQGALVNVLQDTGKDKLFGNRGTRLFRTALDGGIFNIRSASHVANFAAVDTLFFSREHSTANAENKLKEIILNPTAITLGSLEVEAGFVSIAGQTASFNVPINTLQ